jgi:hypothetical protein
MLAEPFRLRGSNLKMLPNPTADRWPGEASVIEWYDEMIELQVHLENAIKAAREGDIAPDALLITISEQWARMNQVWIRAVDIDMREKIHDALDATANHFQEHQAQAVSESLSRVVASHIGAVLAASDDLQKAMNRSSASGKLMRYYIAKILPKVANVDLADDVRSEVDILSRVATMNFPDESKNKKTVLWFGLMFRMICWFLLHDFDKMDVNMMNSALKGSRMPVFIG